MDDEPTNMELMRTLTRIEDKEDDRYEEVAKCLWGQNRDNGLVTTTKAHTQSIAHLERIVYGLIGCITAMLVGIGVSLICGVL